MTLKQIGILAGALVLSIVLLAAAFADAGAINRFFANVLLIIAGLSSLIEPSKGLIESVGVLVLLVLATMQELARRERKAQGETIKDIKAAVVPPQDAVS